MKQGSEAVSAQDLINLQHMGQFAQFGFNGFKWGQTHFSQLHIFLDPDKLES